MSVTHVYILHVHVQGANQMMNVVTSLLQVTLCDCQSVFINIQRRIKGVGGGGDGLGSLNQNVEIFFLKSEEKD